MIEVTTNEGTTIQATKQDLSGTCKQIYVLQVKNGLPFLRVVVLFKQKLVRVMYIDQRGCRSVDGVVTYDISTIQDSDGKQISDEDLVVWASDILFIDKSIPPIDMDDIDELECETYLQSNAESF